MHPGVVVVFFKQKQLFITFELIRSLSQCKVDVTDNMGVELSSYYIKR